MIAHYMAMKTDEELLARALARSRAELGDRLTEAVSRAYVDLQHAQLSGDVARAKQKLAELARLERAINRLQKQPSRRQP